MRVFKFWLISLVSFIIATIINIFISSSLLNRTLAIAFCTIFSLNSTCLLNLNVVSDKAVAAISPLEKTAKIYNYLTKQELNSVENKDDTLLAFKADPPIHGDMTTTAIQGNQNLKLQWATITDEKHNLKESIYVEYKSQTELNKNAENQQNNKLKFTSKAINEIIYENLHTDLGDGIGGKPGVFTSNEFDKPWNHFDNEQLGHGSYRLIALKKVIINKIKNVQNADKEAEKGKLARQILGTAIHSLQDFYAHSNWYEMGNKKINQHLGKKLICYRPRTLPVNFFPDDLDPKEVSGTEFEVKNFDLTSDIKCALPPSCTVDACEDPIKQTSDLDPKDPKHQKWSEWVTADPNPTNITATPDSPDNEIYNSYHPGFLLPNLNKLTSGYYLGNGPIDSCKAPLGKVRHGLRFLRLGINCPTGLNKDEPDRSGHEQAKELAIVATRDYIYQILDEISSNIHAVRVLMGLPEPQEEEKENPCKSEKNKKRKECELKEGQSFGDPHLITFDGLRYSFQTVGEFTLVKSNDGKFEVQVRQTPVNSNLSLNSAVAMKLGSDRVTLYAKDLPDADTSTPLRVNNKPTTIQGDKLTLSSGGIIAKTGNTYIVDFPMGEKVVITPSSAGGNPFLNVSPFVYNQSGKYSGLLGNMNGNSNDDQEIRGGGNVLISKSTYGDVNRVLNLVGLRVPGALAGAEKLYFDQLYKQFGNSWRIKQEESLFDYPPGKTTQNYTDTSFPDQYLKLEMLSPEQVQKARKECTEAGVDQNLMEGCIFDVGFSGFSDFARTTAQINSYINIINQVFPGLNIPTVNQTVDRVINRIKPRVCLPGLGCL